MRSSVDGTTHKVFPVGIGAEEGEALRDRVRGEGAAYTIEIGLAYGISALFACEGLLTNGFTNARHVVVDPNQETRFASCGLQALDEAGVSELVEYHPGSSEIALLRFLAEGRRFDLAFIDGNHRFEGVFLDLTYLGRLVRAGGIIFVDDYQLYSVAREVSFYVNNLDWTVEEVSTHNTDHHWAVLRTATVPKQRAFDHYIDF